MKTCMIFSIFFLGMMAMSANGQFRPATTTAATPWWWQFFFTTPQWATTTTTRFPQGMTTRAVTTTTTKQPPQTAPNLPPLFPTMMTGAQKTTPAAPKPINDDASVPCGFNTFLESNPNYYGGSQGIVGGEDARQNEFPWQVGILHQGSFICGGSLISRRHVLTAAHCLVSTTPSNFQVVLGDHNRRTTESGERTYRISSIIKHPKNSAQNNQFDFAIFVISGTVPFDRQWIRPVCLPPANLATDSLAGQNGYVSGWGKTAESGSTASTLQKALVPVLSQQSCINSYGSITSDMMCAGYTGGKIDSCQGDSGGPLVVLSRQDNRFYLQGVTSWGYGCARPNYPGVYARVSSVIDWISSTMASS